MSIKRAINKLYRENPLSFVYSKLSLAAASEMSLDITAKIIAEDYPIFCNRLIKILSGNNPKAKKCKSMDNLRVPAWSYYIDYSVLRNCKPADPLTEVAALTSKVTAAIGNKYFRRMHQEQYPIFRNRDSRGNSFRFFVGDAPNYLRSPIRLKFDEDIKPEYSSRSLDIGSEVSAKTGILMFKKSGKTVYAGYVKLTELDADYIEHRISEVVSDDFTVAERYSLDMLAAIEEDWDKQADLDCVYDEIYRKESDLEDTNRDILSFIHAIKSMRKEKSIPEDKLQRSINNIYEDLSEALKKRNIEIYELRSARSYYKALGG